MFCGDACKMTRLLGSKTCREVHARLQVRQLQLLKKAQAGKLGSSLQRGACQAPCEVWVAIPNSWVSAGLCSAKHAANPCCTRSITPDRLPCSPLQSVLDGHPPKYVRHTGSSTDLQLLALQCLSIVCLTVMACRPTRSSPLQLLVNGQTNMLNSH